MPRVHVLLVGDSQPIQASLNTLVQRLRDCDLTTLPEDVPLPSELDGFAAVIYYDNPVDDRAVFEFSQQFRARHSNIPLLIVADDPSIEMRGRLLQQGVVDCLDPAADTGRLEFLLDLLTIRARHQRREPCADLSSIGQIEQFLFGSPAMHVLVNQVSHVAPLPVTVLLTGETGTGKTHLARIIHELDSRRTGPFAMLNCSALAPSLMESEMFGHARGAFTGAAADHVGKFEAVGDGTLFLDDINCLPLDLQIKLLRIVEDRQFEPVGSNELRPFTARLIVASNERLHDLVAAGTFRADLYHRLNVVALSVPSLRDRAEEILKLAEMFLGMHAERFERERPDLSMEVCETLQMYTWPGNVRELRNAMERVVALVPEGGVAQIRDLPPDIFDFARSRHGKAGQHTAPASRGNRLSEARDDAERERIMDAIRRASNNRSLAAIDLGISRVTLYKKLHKYGLV